MDGRHTLEVPCVEGYSHSSVPGWFAGIGVYRRLRDEEAARTPAPKRKWEYDGTEWHRVVDGEVVEYKGGMLSADT